MTAHDFGVRAARFPCVIHGDIWRVAARQATAFHLMTDVEQSGYDDFAEVPVK